MEELSFFFYFVLGAKCELFSFYALYFRCSLFRKKLHAFMFLFKCFFFYFHVLTYLHLHDS